MDNDHQLDIFMTISQQLGEMNASMKSVLERLTNHETRIQLLEKSTTAAGEDDASKTKDKVILILAKCVAIALVVIGTFSGCAGMLKVILGI